MAEPKEVILLNEQIEMMLSGASAWGDEDDILEPVRLESDRTLRNWALQIYRRGSGGAPEVHALAEADGTARVHTIWRWQQVDPVPLTGANELVFLPGGVAADLWEVDVLVNNHSAATALLTLGYDIGNGGTLAATEGYASTQIVPSQQDSGWRTIHIAGDDSIRATPSINDVLVAFVKARQIAGD